jgi:hypothetical protein
MTSERSCCSDSCCGGAASSAAAVADSVREKVREGYSRIAQGGGGCCGGGGSGGGCCGPATFTPEQLAHAMGYARSDLSSVPQSAHGPVLREPDRAGFAQGG